MAGPAFATAAELSTFIGVTTPSSTTRMDQLLATASALIRRYAGQTLSQVVNDVVVIQPEFSYTTGQSFLLPNRAMEETILLPERPVTAVASAISNGVSITNFNFTRSGLLYRTDGFAWIFATTVTYTHGFATGADELDVIKGICMEVASRAYTMNRDNAAVALGNTVMESAGYGPEIFLTPGEKNTLQFTGKAFVG